MLRCAFASAVLAIAASLQVLSAQVPSGSDDAPVQGASGKEAQRPETPRRGYHLEFGSFDSVVNNGFGHWWGGDLQLSYKPSGRMVVSGQLLSQSRPGETEQFLGVGALVNWSKWFYTNSSVSGGGPDDSAAFFPRLRYDLAAGLKLPTVPGLILTGG
ncbi:MAG: YaiO family outer membrane beta-barrel protein, partial [Acidobacteria bacterium]|nr:YaiO family outer membrane beta-barrel protein [Acidobacteriota bacterium]